MASACACQDFQTNKKPVILAQTWPEHSSYPSAAYIFNCLGNDTCCKKVSLYRHCKLLYPSLNLLLLTSAFIMTT
eukprot:scaffold575048_cov17-Prasinocladus_malaysianus.AAC.1